MIAAMASRICGSADLYQHINKEPLNSVNFITCHDGFTLNDLVSYKQKHNEANGEGNQDGTNLDYSHNYGFEGDTDDPEIESIRTRQIKNMLATLFISRGVPMLLGGDEFRRTQRGNNNAYCQDNEVSWYDWNLLRKHHEIYRFTKMIIAFRKRHKLLRAEKFYTEKEISWVGPNAEPPVWEGAGRILGCIIHARDRQRECPDKELCILFSAENKEVDFKLPNPPAGELWHVAVNTANASPDDICEEGNEPLPANQDRFRLKAGSMVILIADKKSNRTAMIRTTR